ncbi:rubredoxin [Vibrio mexicanus]|uniref:rubredoxin n=1 Tax=Vibrio mexicanus TaxID=1004326 RepID=UPI0009495D05|nr:rubredoxin [Vibrio mexicanus]
MSKHTCSVCGYVYNPEQGDTRNDVEPGTSWEELSSGWNCPVCHVDKDFFETDD